MLVINLIIAPVGLLATKFFTILLSVGRFRGEADSGGSKDECPFR